MADAPPSHGIWDILTTIFQTGAWVGGITSIVQLIVGRKKQRAEVKQIAATVEVSEATADKTKAEGRNIDSEYWTKLIKLTWEEAERMAARHKAEREEWAAEEAKKDLQIRELQKELLKKQESGCF